MDRRLEDYIRERGLILDLTGGGTAINDGMTVKLLGPKEIVLAEIRPIPAFINGKFFDDLTLEEFLEWEQSTPSCER